MILSGIFLVVALAIPAVCFDFGSNPDCRLPKDKLLPSLFFQGGSSSRTLYGEALTVIVFAFFGAYLASLRLFIRAVANFDLSPLTFSRANLYIISAPVIAVVLLRGSQQLLGIALTDTVTFACVLIVAFMIGLYPALGERLLGKAWRYGMLKRIDPRATDNAQIVPLEIIEGVDTEIRARLEDHNLYDVQNLATANPIILFVETPFGIYQSIDWVAQAQLATGVGVSRFLALRNLGIRTIFDFESAVGPGNGSSEALKERIALILFPTSDSPPSEAAEARAVRVKEAERLCEIIVDDLATLRLRQIWVAIRTRFGEWHPLDQAHKRI